MKEIVKLKEEQAYNWLIEITLMRVNEYDDEHDENNTLYVDNDEDGFIHDVVVAGADGSEFPRLYDFLAGVNYIVMYDKYSGEYMIRVGKKRTYVQIKSVGDKETISEEAVKEVIGEFVEGLNTYLNSALETIDWSEVESNEYEN